LAALVSEAYTGARLVKAYRMEEYETARAIELIKRRFAHIMRMVRARAAASPATEALGGIAVGAAIFYGGFRASEGTMTLGAFGSFITALLLAYQPAKSLANFNTVLQEGMAAAARLYALLDVEPRVADKPGAKPLAIGKAEIVFTDVDFSYGADEPPALDRLSLRVEGAKRVALVGPSGAGKSTILSLIPRFFDVASGAVTIDGQDIREVTLASLRDAVALVTQDAILFDDTVRANIAYGRPQATSADIVASAKAAAAHDFITGLPQGYDTRLGEHGVRLSGGERQRIAIARAMLKNAPILLLDEATSQLDSESEQQVQIALGRLMRGRTTLVIAHRLSTVVDSDQIYVIDSGRVAEHGRHSELLAHGGAYARLYATQFAARPAAREASSQEATERRASA
jgi:subfamily B ATP-binding cassette protein MsbA